ncbi:hypothetical protein ACFX13_030786 [Malus domestica]
MAPQTYTWTECRIVAYASLWAWALLRAAMRRWEIGPGFGREEMGDRRRPGSGIRRSGRRRWWEWRSHRGSREDWLCSKTQAAESRGRSEPLASRKPPSPPCSMARPSRAKTMASPHRSGPLCSFPRVEYHKNIFSQPSLLKQDQSRDSQQQSASEKRYPE